MEMSIRQKIQSIDVFKMAVQDYTDNTYEVYMDNVRAPKLIEEAILFYLQVKGEIYINEVLNEMKKN